MAWADEGEAHRLVEAMRGCVVGHRIDQHCGDRGIGEAAAERECHHGAAMAPADRVSFADPDVDGTEAGRAIAPVTALLLRRVDDLEEADRPPLDLGDENLAPRDLAAELVLPVPVVPVGVAAGLPHVGLGGPVQDEGKIVFGGAAEMHCVSVRAG